MKNMLLIIPIIFLFAILINAQPLENAPHLNFEKLKLELNLSGEQAEKFESLFKQKMKDLEGIREFFKDDRAGARDKTFEINNKYHKLFSEILDEEQLAKFEELTKERREDRENRPRRMR